MSGTSRKISELTTASSPILGTELMVIVQDSETRQAEVSLIMTAAPVQSVNGETGDVLINPADIPGLENIVVVGQVSAAIAVVSALVSAVSAAVSVVELHVVNVSSAVSVVDVHVNLVSARVDTVSARVDIVSASITQVSIRLDAVSVLAANASAAAGANRQPVVVTVSGTTHNPSTVTTTPFWYLCDNVAGCQVSVPTCASVAFPIGTVITYEQNNVSAAVSIGGSGVTINMPTSRQAKTAEQYAVVQIFKKGPDLWVIYGNLAAA